MHNVFLLPTESVALVVVEFEYELGTGIQLPASVDRDRSHISNRRCSFQLLKPRACCVLCVRVFIPTRK